MSLRTRVVPKTIKSRIGRSSVCIHACKTMTQWHSIFCCVVACVVFNISSIDSRRQVIGTLCSTLTRRYLLCTTPGYFCTWLATCRGVAGAEILWPFLTRRLVGMMVQWYHVRNYHSEANLNTRCVVLVNLRLSTFIHSQMVFIIWVGVAAAVRVFLFYLFMDSNILIQSLFVHDLFTWNIVYKLVAIDPYLNKEMLWFLEAVKLDPLLNLRGECLSVPKVFLLPVATISAPEILEEPEIIEEVAADWMSMGENQIQNVWTS